MGRSISSPARCACGIASATLIRPSSTPRAKEYLPAGRDPASCAAAHQCLAGLGYKNIQVRVADGYFGRRTLPTTATLRPAIDERRSTFRAASAGSMPNRMLVEAIPKAKTAALKAVELDERL